MAQMPVNEVPNDGIEWAKLCAADMLAMGLHWSMMACRLLHASSRVGPNYKQGKKVNQQVWADGMPADMMPMRYNGPNAGK